MWASIRTPATGPTNIRGRPNPRSHNKQMSKLEHKLEQILCYFHHTGHFFKEK